MGQAKAGRPARTYIQQLCEDTGCNPEDLPKAMNDREKWRERVRDIRDDDEDDDGLLLRKRASILKCKGFKDYVRF